MNLRKAGINFLMIAMALCMLTPAAQAADVTIGGGVGFAPDYEGSEDYEFVPVPFASINWSNGMYFRLEGLTARGNVLPAAWVGGLQLGPIYNYRAKRSDVDNNRVDAMNSVSDANELGAFVAFDWNNWFIGLDALADMLEFVRHEDRELPVFLALDELEALHVLEVTIDVLATFEHGTRHLHSLLDFLGGILADFSIG